MRSMWRVEFQAATLLTEIPLHGFVHPKLLALLIRSELFRWASQCKEAPNSVYAAGRIHRLNDLDVYSSQTHTTEHDGPQLALCLSSSGVSGCDRPGS